MGVVKNVGFDHFPKQGPWLGKRHEGVLPLRYEQDNHGYDRHATTTNIHGSRSSFSMMGAHVLGAECQHALK